MQDAGHGLRELDIELMRRLSPRVNVVPVIGRADSLTPLELAESKKLVIEDIEHYRIPIYNFPYDVEEDDEDTIEENAELRSLMPFAITGSDDVLEINGRRVRARQYPWGIVEVENPRHSDFLAIRSALFHSHLADFKEITETFVRILMARTSKSCLRQLLILIPNGISCTRTTAPRSCQKVSQPQTRALAWTQRATAWTHSPWRRNPCA